MGAASNISTFTKEDGSVGATLKSGSTVTQVLAVDSGDLAGTSISVSPGTFSTNVNVTMTTGQSIASSSVLESLQVSGASSMTSASNSVAVLADDVINASKPFTLSIPVTTGTALNLDGTFNSDLLIIVYKVTDASKDADARTVLGILGRKEFEYRDGKVYAAITRFGLYHVAQTDKVIDKGTEKASNDPILTAKQEKTLPEIVFGKIEHTSSEGHRHYVTTTVAGAKPSVCRFLVSKDKTKDCFAVDTKVDGQKIVFDDNDDNDDKNKEKSDSNDSCKSDSSSTSGSSGTKVFYLKVMCKFEDGRFAGSGYSDAFEDNDDSGGLQITSVEAGDYVPYAELNDWGVQGTCQQSGKVVVSVRTVSRETSCTGGNWSVHLDLSTVSSGEQPLTARLFDSRDVVSSEQTVTINIDTSEPTITLTSAATSGGLTFADARNWTAFPLAGSCSESGETVYIYFNDYEFTGTCTSGAWSATLDVSTLFPDNYFVAASQFSRAGRDGASAAIAVTVGAPIYGSGQDGNVLYDLIGYPAYKFSDSLAGVPSPIFGRARNNASLSCDGGLGTGVCRFGFTSDTFIGPYGIVPGNELMWIVHASVGSDTTKNCPASVGTYGFGRVLSVNAGSQTIDIARTTSSSPPTFVTPTISDQCVVQIIRVANMINFEVRPDPTSGSIIYEDPFDWDGNISLGKGGVIAMRVSGAISVTDAPGVPSADPAGFDLTAAGFSSCCNGNYQGSSESGMGSVSVLTANGAGGGAGSAYGGGGGAGHGYGAHGSGASNKGLIRSVLANAGFVDSLPGRLYLGAAGGGTSDSGYTAFKGGGPGGGIIMIFVDTISNIGSAPFTLRADGEISPFASLYSGGGGGGGNIVATVKNLDRTLAMSADGGIAYASSTRGGGGGGGYIHSIICAGVGSAIRSYAGGLGNSNGQTGATTSNTDYCD